MSKADPPDQPDLKKEPVGSKRKKDPPLEPGPATRRQRLLAGEELTVEVSLATRRRQAPSVKRLQRPQSLPVVTERPPVGQEEDYLPVFTPRTPGSISVENLVPLLSSTLQDQVSAGPSTGRSDKTFNYSGRRPRSPGLWLTRDQLRSRKDVSSVDSFQAAVDAAHLEVSHLSSEGSSLDEDFQEAIERPLPPDLASEPSDQAPKPSEQASEPSDQLLDPPEQPLVPPIVEAIVDVEAHAVIMAVQETIIEYRNTILECREVIDEDFIPVRMDRVEYDYLKQRVDEAEEWKKNMRKMCMYLNTHDTEYYVRELRTKSANWRKELADFVSGGQEQLAELAAKRAGMPRNPTEAAQAAARDIKAKSVEEYSPKTVLALEALKVRCDTVKDGFTRELDQIEFRKLEEGEKALAKEIEAALKDAQKLRSDAVDAGMAAEAANLEKVARELQEKQVAVATTILNEKIQRNLVLSGGTSGIRSSDLTPPLFSGEHGNDNYFKFCKELDNYTAVKCPSNEELLRVLLTRCLTKEPKLACEHMKTKDEVMTYLRTTYGNVQVLIQNELALVRKFGPCKGPESSQRSWAIAAQAKMHYIQQLAEDHDLEDTLYHSNINSELQSKLPMKLQDEFLSILEKLNEGQQPSAQEYFSEFMAFLGKLVTRFNYRLSLGVNLGEGDHKSSIRDPVKTAANRDGKKPPPKRGYTVQDGRAAGADGRAAGSDGYRQRGGRRTVKQYNTNAVESKCSLCQGKHSYIYYCEVFQEATVDDRYKLTWQAGVCFRCLQMNSCVDFNDRKAWFADHRDNCKTPFVCKLDKCGDKPKAKQRNFLLCSYHKDKNQAMERRFMDALDKTKVHKDVKFFFSGPMLANWQCNYGKARELQGWDTIPDVAEPTIFMLTYVVINDVKLLVFFDSGCATASISENVKRLINTENVREGPTDISVASGKVLRIPGGEERFAIPLSDGKRRCTVTALCMPAVTTPFPVWELKAAAEELNNHYKQWYPTEDLPEVPDTVGGSPIDIMIGIRYLRFFPQFRFMMDCGLSMYQSCFASPEGKDGVLAGPHRSWRNVGETSHLVHRAYAAVPVNPPRVDHVPVQPVIVTEVHLHGDQVNSDGFVEDSLTELGCSNLHCDVHREDVYDVPDHWDITGSSSSYSTFSKDRLVRFLDGEDMGTSVAYRCPACRNCSSCRSGNILEEVSLNEEREQFIIEKSVQYDANKKQLVAKLPFTANPTEKLTQNLHIAKRVFGTQMKKASSDENVRLGIVAAHKKLYDRQFICKLNDLPDDVRAEVDALVGYTIPWRTVMKESSLSTPIRMVFDASSGTPGGDSLNNLLAKGSNTLGNLLAILVKFRLKRCAFTADVSMAYNGLRLHPSHLAYHKFLWRDGMSELSPLEVWVILTLIYGVRSSGNQTTVGFNILADFVLANPELHNADLGAIVLKFRAYMDDLLSSHDTAEEAARAAQELRYVLSLGSMAVKDITFNSTAPSELVSTDGKHVGLLGLLWDSKEDIITVDIGELYLGKRKRGKSPEIIEDDLTGKLAKQFTRRIIVGKVASVYDPLGLLTPVTAKYKLQLHDLCGKKLDWDDRIPEEYFNTWLNNIEEMQTLGDIRFPRSVVPSDAANLKISYIISSDASEEIAITSVHSRMLKTDGTYHVQLIMAKSKIITNLTVPRAELKGMVMGASLGHCITRCTEDRLDEVVHVTDSAICLYWLKQDQRPLQTGVRNAVLEIRRLTDLDSWYHIESAENVADIGTRRTVQPDMSPNSDWVSGKDWMKTSGAQMPLKTLEEISLNSADKKLAAQETKNKDIGGIVLHNLKTKVSERLSYTKYLVDPTRLPWQGTLKAVAIAFRFIDTCLKKVCKRGWSKVWFPPPSNAPQSEKDFFDMYKGSRTQLWIINQWEIDRAKNYLFMKATSEVKHFTKRADWLHCVEKNKILYYNSRIIEGQEVENVLGEGLDVEPLMFVKPVVDRYSPLAYCIMSYAHATLARHRNVAETVRESRTIAYIFGGRDLAIEIREACPYCRRYKARLITRSMGKLHDNRFVIAPPFYGVQCDMFGPLLAICEHNHRSTVKVWGLVFKDPSCGAIAVYCMAKYNTASFVMAYTRHASRYGHPKRVVIDAGSQLVKAVKDMKTSLVELEGLVRIQHQVGIEFRVVPVGSHYQNGQVERGIKEIRTLFHQVYSGLKLDILSYETAFAWIANEINCFPRCLGSRTDQLDNLDLITPSRLMHGRNNRRCLSGHATVEMPSKLLDQMEDTTKAWWKVWEKQRIQEYIAQPSKWLQSGGTVNKGDIVVFLRQKKDLAVGEPVWRVGRVTELAPGRDGQCRQVTVEYRNADEEVFRKVVLDSRQVAILHHEGELDLIDVLNEASRENNILYHLNTLGKSGTPLGSGIQVPVKHGGLENPPVICNEVGDGTGNLESCTPAAVEKKLKARYLNPATSPIREAETAGLDAV